MHTKHTPGPWDVLPESAIGEGEGRDCYSLNAGNPQHSPSCKEAYANAALMAAAPEMLAALIDLMAIIDSPQISIYGVVGQQWIVTKRETRAAIARATGAAQ